jgi:hypothetical protein
MSNLKLNRRKAVEAKECGSSVDMVVTGKPLENMQWLDVVIELQYICFCDAAFGVVVR